MAAQHVRQVGADESASWLALTSQHGESRAETTPDCQATIELIMRLGNALGGSIVERLETAGMTSRMFSALAILAEEGGVTQQRLSTCCRLHPSSIVSLVDQLEARGMAERHRHPRDRRAYALTITARGLDALEQGREIMRGVDGQLFAALSDAERARLHRLLSRLLAL